MGGRELSRSGSPSLCLIFTTLFLPPWPRSPLPPPASIIRWRSSGQKSPSLLQTPLCLFVSTLHLHLHCHRGAAPPPTPTAPVPLSISFSSVLPLLCSCLHLFFSSFLPLCPPTSARAAEQIKCDIGCFIPELHTRWKLLFMTQTKSFFTVIPPNCCKMIREEPDMIMMRCDWE